MSDRRSFRIAVAIFAGTVVRVTRRPLRSALRAAPGAAGAAAVAVGLGELAGHLWGAGLAPWVALSVGGVFLLLFASELNARPPAPTRDE